MSQIWEQLRKRKDDRGMMANLRCVLVDGKKHRAWPALHRLGVAIQDDVTSFVVGLFAMHPENTATGNFGNTCREIQKKRGEQQDEDVRLTPTERRFQHLLASADRHELKDRLRRIVLLAKAYDVRVNYKKLITDITCWERNDRTKTEWATSFWAQSAPNEEEGA